MKQRVLGSMTMVFASAASAASAHGCPGELRRIDAKMPSARWPTVVMSKFKAWRAESKNLHKLGKHTEPTMALAEANKFWGV